MEEYGDYSLIGKATVTENNLSKQIISIIGLCLSPLQLFCSPADLFILYV